MKNYCGMSEVQHWRVIDGDTIEVTVYLGFGVMVEKHIRLARCNAPEIMTPQGQRSAAWLETLLTATCSHSMLIYSRDITDRYGRNVAELYYTRDGLRWHCLSDVSLLSKASAPATYNRQTQPLDLGLQTYADPLAPVCG